MQAPAAVERRVPFKMGMLKGSTLGSLHAKPCLSKTGSGALASVTQGLHS